MTSLLKCGNEKVHFNYLCLLFDHDDDDDSYVKLRYDVVSFVIFTDAPRLVSLPSDKTVIETAMVVFFCNATGNPRPQIRWTRDGTPVANGTTLSFDAKRNDTGTYQCSADNGLETSDTSRATLLVQCKYYVSLDYLQVPLL